MRYIVVAVAIAAVAAPFDVHAARPVWEQVSVPSPQHQAGADEVAAERTSVTVRGGYIYVTCARPENVKIFTILGQLVSQQTLPAGTSRLRLKERGVYILKTDSLTRRVTI